MESTGGTEEHVERFYFQAMSQDLHIFSVLSVVSTSLYLAGPFMAGWRRCRGGRCWS